MWLIVLFSFLLFCDKGFVFGLSSEYDGCNRTDISDFRSEFEVMKGNFHTLLKRVISNENEISDLKNQNNELKNTVRLCSCKIEELNDIIIQNQCNLNETRSQFNQELLILRSDWMNQNKKVFIGFSAYMSEDFVEDHSKSLTKGDTIIFDKTETNSDNVYKTATGVFTAPSSGMYAFTWTLCVDSRINDGGYGEFETELVVDGLICGTLHADTETQAQDACSTGFIIKYVRKSGKVYLRNSGDHQGSFLSKDSQTRTTFSGWKLN
ncbi:Hypothetical predicted protein [Mytilus galloprovincialis]|nr:Hypothetical predicted protein [Mytilus galloprovincialis]